jgi:hypothetical protein
MTLESRELFGTNGVVSKKQYKFYAQSELVEACQRIFDAQGCNFSEGIDRLVRLLVSVPETMRPIVLLQAPGEAAIALAEHTIEQGKAETISVAIPRDVYEGLKAKAGDRSVAQYLTSHARGVKIVRSVAAGSPGASAADTGAGARKR